MAGGSILTGLVLAAIGVFVIEREFVKAAAFALGRRGADLLRLHAWRRGRRRPRPGRDAVGRLGLPHRRRFLFALARAPAIVDAPVKAAVPAEYAKARDISLYWPLHRLQEPLISTEAAMRHHVYVWLSAACARSLSGIMIPVHASIRA